MPWEIPEGKEETEVLEEEEDDDVPGVDEKDVTVELDGDAPPPVAPPMGPAEPAAPKKTKMVKTGRVVLSEVTTLLMNDP